MPGTRVLIIVFDALRPEFVTPELMPNLHGFCARGTRFSRARSTFPTETRVNQSAVLTGCMPARHGVVGNRFMAEDLLPGRLINTGDNAVLAEAARAGAVLDRPTLGQRLAAAGLSYAALSAGTPGGGRLINLTAEEGRSHRLAMRAPEACVPAGFASEIIARIGPMPDYSLPATRWIDWAVAAYLEHIEPVMSPDVMLLWLCEPDESFHYIGVGAPGALETLENADRAFGRILEHHSDALADGSTQIIAMSDHGQITLSGEPLDLPARLAEIGVTASTSQMEGADCVVAVHTAGGIWVRDRDPALVEKILDWLTRQDWCGPLFTRYGLPGTLPQAALRINHARAPDISLVLRADDGVNDHGRDGRSVHDAPYPVGGGCHGGLHARETHTFLACGGRAFAPGAVSDAPAGNIDIMPTVMALLGQSAPDGIDGRALTGDLKETPEAKQRVLTSELRGAFRTNLAVTDIGPARYLDRAWVED